MKFLCEKATLTNAISIVSRTVSPKSSLAFLEGIYLAAGEDLRLTGYNLETGITVRLDATIRRTGECVMPARMFADIVRKLPEDVVSVEVDENFTILSGHGRVEAAKAEGMKELPFTSGVKMACVVMTMLPVMCVYPFLQRYFLKGMRVGAVKG